jgi:hypothetical protein
MSKDGARLQLVQNIAASAKQNGAGYFAHSQVWNPLGGPSKRRLRPGLGAPQRGSATDEHGCTQMKNIRQSRRGPAGFLGLVMGVSSWDSSESHHPFGRPDRRVPRALAFELECRSSALLRVPSERW